MVRVKFAPSPTGYLHIGGARTALFNWLYARQQGGAFVLRIEDTDAERSSWDMVAGIVEGLRWLGLDWDEGPDVGGPHAPYFQSERIDQYRDMADRLVAEGAAYRCYCSPERLKAKREEAEAQGTAWKYDRACLGLAAEQRASLHAAGALHAVRFLVPDGRTRFNDLVHGEISFDHANIEDFVILRSDRQPTYHLSVVTDDIAMRISDVIRGDDHISNTPKQILLYYAFGALPPRFAHVPLILGTDRKRLSKRHGATSVMEYPKLGYLPEAMVNFLALLGWSPGGDEEIFTRDELVRRFSLEGISGGNAVFNPEKLDWFNTQHLARLDELDVIGRMEPVLREAGLWNDSLDPAWLRRVANLVRSRVKRLEDFVGQLRPFLSDEVSYDPGAVAKHLREPELSGHLTALRDAYSAAQPFDAATAEAVLRDIAAARGIKAAALIHATRIAATGRAVSPGLFEVLELLGRERVILRIDRLLRFLAELGQGNRAITAQPSHTAQQ